MASAFDGDLALLLDVSIKAALLAVVAGGGMRVLRVRNSNVRHRVWTAVLVGMLLLPLLVTFTPSVSLPAWLYPKWTTQNVPPSAIVNSTPSSMSPLADAVPRAVKAKPLVANQPPPEAVKNAPAKAAPSAGAVVPTPLIEQAARATEVSGPRPTATTISTLLLVVYVSGVVFFAGRFVAGVLRARRLVREADLVMPQPAPARLLGATVVLASPAVRVPLTVGWPRPCILLPTDWNRWSDSLLAAVLTHEKAHVRRGDHWLVLLAEWNRAIYWFHPVAWFVRRRLTTLAEQICDDAVIERTGDRPEYARNLLAVAGRLTGERGRLRATGVAMVRGTQVERRVNAILDAGRPLARRIGLVGGLAMLLVAAPPIFLAAGLKAEPEAPSLAQPATAIDSEESAEGKTTLHGRVVDESGRGVANAHLWLPLKHSPLPKEEPVVEAATGDQGEFSLDVPNRWIDRKTFLPHAVVWCYSPGYRVAIASVYRTLLEGVGEPLEIQLSDKTDTSFVVTAPDGRPVQGARVEPWHFEVVSTNYDLVPEPLRQRIGGTTDEQGRVALSAQGRLGLSRVSVKADGYGTQLFRLDHSDHEPAERSLKLSKTGSLSGRLVSDDPDAVQNVEVVVYERMDTKQKTTGRAETRTDDQGRFTVPQFAEGPVTLWFSIDKSLPLRPRIPEEINVEAEKSTEVDIPLEPAVRVRGIVRTVEAHDPVPDALVVVSYGPPLLLQSQSVRSDAEGKFEAFVLPGQVRQQLITRPDPFHRRVEDRTTPKKQIEVSPQVTTFELPPIELAETFERAGKLVDQNHRPIAGARVWAEIRRLPISIAETHEDGLFALWLPKDASIDTFWVSLTLRSRRTEATIEQEEPLVLVAAGLTREDGGSTESDETTAAADTHDADTPKEDTPNVASKKEAGMASVLSGRIVDDTGAPVTDAVVQITGSKDVDHENGRRYRQSYDAKTDESGRYQLDRVEQTDEFTVRITSERWVGLTNWRSLPRIQLGPESRVDRNFTLPRACRLRVQTVDERGAPIRGVRIYTASLKAERFENVEGMNTDEEGWAAIGGLRASDVDYVVGTSHDDFAFTKLLVKLDDPEKVVSRKIVLAKGVDVPGVALCSDGKPAAGWSVNALPDWWQFGSYPSGKEIGPQGTFLLTHLGPDRYNVTVSVPQGNGMFRVVPVLTSTPLPPDEGVLDLNLDTPSQQSMVAISGRVRFTGGSPTKRVEVSARSEDGQSWSDASIEVGGNEFRIEPLPPGRYLVQFSSTEIDQLTKRGVTAPSDDLDVELHVTGQPSIRGKVVRGDTDEAVRSFRLRIAKLRTLRGPNYVPNAYWRTYDNPEGTFDVDTVGPGVYQLLIAADGMAWTRSEPINTDEDLDEPLVLKLGTGTKLSGTVVDETGRPIDGATVVPLSSASGSMPRTVASFATDDGAVKTVDGRFTLEHLTPGKDSLKVTHPDYCFALVEDVEVPDERATVPPITLTRGGTVEGHVYDANGEPETEVTLYFQDREGYGGGGDEEAGRIATAVTDANGYYQAQHLPSQLCYVQRAEEWNSWGVVRNAVLPENGQSRTLDFGGTQPVTGRLLVNGAPLANAKVELTGENPTFGIYKAYAQTDNDGAFVFWSPPTGRWTLYYLVPGRRSDWAQVKELRITSGPQHLGTIEHQSVEVEVQVEELPADAVSQSRVMLREYNPNWTHGNTVGVQRPRQSADEPFVFDNVPPGTYELVCYRPNLESVLQKFEVLPNKQRLELAVVWPAGTASLHGKISEAVCGPGGCNPPHLWKSDRRFTALIMPGADGTYQLDDLPAGDYYITSWDTRDAVPVVEFSLADGEDKTLDLTPDVYSPSPLGVGMLVLRVFTSDGVPLPGCEISMSGPEGKLEQSSAQQGRVVFVGPPGEYSLTVGYPGFESTRQQVTIGPTAPDGRPTGEYELRIQLQRDGNAETP